MNLKLSKPGTRKRTYIFQLHILRMIKIALNLLWQPPRPIAQHITMLAHGFTSRKCESLGQTCATIGFVLLPRGSPSVASWASLCCLVGLVGGFWKIIVVACANQMFISEKFTANSPNSACTEGFLLVLYRITFMFQDLLSWPTCLDLPRLA